MKKRIKEIEEEAGALREMQAKAEKEMGADQGFFTSACALNLWIRFRACLVDFEIS